MKGNLKNAVIMLMSLGFVFGLALGKIHDDARSDREALHYQTFHYHTSSVSEQTLQLQEEIRLRIEEKLHRVKEMQLRAQEQAEKAAKMRLKVNCH